MLPIKMLHLIHLFADISLFGNLVWNRAYSVGYVWLRVVSIRVTLQIDLLINLDLIEKACLASEHIQWFFGIEMSFSHLSQN